jgi:magnesium transporter
MSSSGTSPIDHLPERVQELVAAGDLETVAETLEELHPSDVADLLEFFESEEERVALVRVLSPELASEALAEMEESEHRGDLLAALDPEEGAGLLHELADDDAVDLIAELSAAEAHAILEALPRQEAGDLRGLLLYGEETAGGRMTTDLVAIPGTLSAGEAIREIRRLGREVEDFYTVFVVDPDGVLLGAVPLDDLILADTATSVADIAEPFAVTVASDTDQEDVGRILSRYNLVSVPVCDDQGRLLGRITFDDVIDVIEAEQTEDILRLAGVSEEEEVRADWKEAVGTRLPWLSLNLLTAAAAASVVFVFGDTIDQLWYLAAIMPIVAGMGGNSGTQALAVTVRRIAVSQGPLEKRFDAVGKELLVGLVNGLVLGGLAAAVAYAASVTWPQVVPPLLPLVVLLAMWGNIVVAGFSGAFIPTVLDRMGVDPAVASSVFVTTMTDLFGFFLLLGLAAALLL